MTAKIDSDGCLYIQRPGGQWVKQLCPYDPDYRRHCSHACPLFGDPVEEFLPYRLLALCHGTLRATINDERKHKT